MVVLAVRGSPDTGLSDSWATGPRQTTSIGPQRQSTRRSEYRRQPTRSHPPATAAMHGTDRLDRALPALQTRKTV